MFPEKPELVISIPSKTELLKMIVEMTKHIAIINQFPPSDAQKVALALDEAVTNVIKHSYRGSMDENIRVEFYCHAKGIKIKIIFTGVPPVLAKAGIDLDKMIKQKKKGGLGVELMKRIMDSVEYKTEENINICEMIKWKTQES
ncbi:MAG: ATP-binding protein [Candidatus Aminicenantes bacterium]|nr:ATP-binding protein [Candidatus Aminicenantes bacterium]